MSWGPLWIWTDVQYIKIYSFKMKTSTRQCDKDYVKCQRQCFWFTLSLFVWPMFDQPLKRWSLWPTPLAYCWVQLISWMNSRLHNYTKEWINQRLAEFEYPGADYVKVSVSARVKQTLISGTFQSQVPPLMKPNQLFHANNYHWGANLSEVISTTHTEAGKNESSGSEKQEVSFRNELQQLKNKCVAPNIKKHDDPQQPFSLTCLCVID